MAPPTHFFPQRGRRNMGIQGEITGISLAQQTKRERPHLVCKPIGGDASADDPREYPVLVRAA
jgi:hypothetical protein